jgi:hypothetical protein
MLTRWFATVTTTLALVGGTAAAPTAQPQTTKPAENVQPAGQQPPRPPGQLANVRLDIAITDQRGDAPATPKVVTLIVGDHENGRVRLSRNASTLNVDARPDIPREGRVRVALTLEYRPGTAEGDRPDTLILSETLSVVVEEGKPLVISQSADPLSDRRIKVELKATVVRAP